MIPRKIRLAIQGIFEKLREKISQVSGFQLSNHIQGFLNQYNMATLTSLAACQEMLQSLSILISQINASETNLFLRREVDMLERELSLAKTPAVEDKRSDSPLHNTNILRMQRLRELAQMRALALEIGLQKELNLDVTPDAPVVTLEASIHQQCLALRRFVTPALNSNEENSIAQDAKTIRALTAELQLSRLVMPSVESDIGNTQQLVEAWKLATNHCLPSGIIALRIENQSILDAYQARFESIWNEAELAQQPQDNSAWFKQADFLIQLRRNSFWLQQLMLLLEHPACSNLIVLYENAIQALFSDRSSSISLEQLNEKIQAQQQIVIDLLVKEITQFNVVLRAAADLPRLVLERTIHVLCQSYIDLRAKVKRQLDAMHQNVSDLLANKKNVEALTFLQQKLPTSFLDPELTKLLNTLRQRIPVVGEVANDSVNGRREKAHSGQKLQQTGPNRLPPVTKFFDGRSGAQTPAVMVSRPSERTSNQTACSLPAIRSRGSNAS